MAHAGKLCLHLFLLALAACASAAWAQSDADLQGRWEGTLGGKLRLVVELSRASDGLWLGRLTSVDQGNAAFSLDDIQVSDGAVTFAVNQVRGKYEGKVDAAGKELIGTWTQGPVQPLRLRKVDAAPAATTAQPANPPRPAESWPFGTPLIAGVPVPPTGFIGAGRQHFVYEIHLTNFSGAPLDLKRVDVLDARTESPSEPLLRLEGAELIAALQPVGMRSPPGLADLRTLAAGSRVVMYVWLTLDLEAPVPQSFRHRIAVGAREFDAATVELRPATSPVLGRPLEGAAWLAGNGPDNASGHRRALIPIDGRATIAQRFAIDWLKIGPDGRTFKGKAEDNRSYHAYGAEVLAVVDGKIVAVHDGIPENVPGASSRAVPITLETVGGNYVILALGDNRYAVYAHLKPGSLRVKVGDRVKRGQVLGLLGNSGNSTEPHLHFHVCDGPAPLTSEGIPYLFESFDVYDSAGKATLRRNELPLLNTVVGFK